MLFFLALLFVAAVMAIDPVSFKNMLQADSCDSNCWTTDKDRQITSRLWAGRYSDGKLLRTMRLMGTHDSCTSEMDGLIDDPYWTPSMCQTLTIAEQLVSGIRYFDIRVKANKWIYHGSSRTEFNLERVRNNIRDFLADNSNEFVIMRLKAEDGEKQTYLDARSYLLGSSRFFTTDDASALTYADLKGKCLIVNFEYDAEDLGNHAIEDHWHQTGADKWDSVQDFIKANKDNTKLLFIHLSSNFGTPIQQAKYVNNKFCDADPNIRGIFIADFPSCKLIKRVKD